MDEVEKLIEDLKSGDVDVRMSAADKLGKMGRRAVPALIKELKKENWESRSAVIEVLIGIGGPAVPKLIKALKNDDVETGARLVLMRIEDDSVVPALIRALKDNHTDVQLRAAWVLGNIRDASAVPALIEALKDDDRRKEVYGFFVPLNAKRALRKIGKPAVPEMIEALKHKDESVRWGVAEALGGMIERCETIDEVGEFEEMLKELSATLGKGRVAETTMISAQIQVAKLTGKIAERKDALAPKRDLLLDDRPKPPKKGSGVYQVSRRVRNG